MNIYQRAKTNGCQFVATCSQVTLREHERLFKGARTANRKKVVRAAMAAGVISEEDGRRELNSEHWNPYEHYVTRTHIIYVHSAVDHFIEVNP